MITGGTDGDGGYLRSVELYNPSQDTTSTCYLPPILGLRYGHTLNGEYICGGGVEDNELRSCVKFLGGVWSKTSHTLLQRRGGHSSWRTDDGILLLGSYYSSDTSEIMKFDGSVEQTFNLKYDTV